MKELDDLPKVTELEGRRATPDLPHTLACHQGGIGDPQSTHMGFQVIVSVLLLVLIEVKVERCTLPVNLWFAGEA